jgi:hypothetical protein
MKRVYKVGSCVREPECSRIVSNRPVLVPGFPQVFYLGLRRRYPVRGVYPFHFEIPPSKGRMKGDSSVVDWTVIKPLGIFI